MSEPSKWAVEAAGQICHQNGCYNQFGMAFAIPKVQSAIDAATAEKDREIERLKECLLQMQNAAIDIKDELDCQEKATAFVNGHYEKAKQHIQAMAALLDKVPHSHQNAPIPRSLAMDNDTDWQCVYSKDCPACAWAAMKSALDGRSENAPAKKE